MIQKKKAVFLDRDGTLIRHVDMLSKEKQIRLLPGVARAVTQLNENGFLVIVATNQAVVSRGMITEEEVIKLHTILARRLAKQGARIDDIFFCPHHPDAQSDAYGVVCRCRKPEPGMLLQAIEKHHIDPTMSFMIGDALIDCVAGQRAGVKTILVATGPGHPRIDALYQNTRPNYKAKNLTDAVRYILRET